MYVQQIITFYTLNLQQVYVHYISINLGEYKNQGKICHLSFAFLSMQGIIEHRRRGNIT